MAAKRFSLQLDEELQAVLCNAIRLYADAAYPPGGSECAQVARETLLDTANTVEKQFADKGVVEVSRRLKSQLKAALQFFSEANNANGKDVSGPVSRLLDIITICSRKTG